nr:MAG TPA: hypothetical protein [Caudoviricetes sp.]
MSQAFTVQISTNSNPLKLYGYALGLMLHPPSKKENSHKAVP